MVHLICGCHSSVFTQNFSMPIQYSSGAPSTDLPPPSSGTNLQSPSSQSATAQPASAASGSSQHGASAPAQFLARWLIWWVPYLSLLFVIITIIVVAFGCMQEYFPSRTRYLLYRYILVCHSSLCDGALRVSCLACVLLCCYMLFYLPVGGGGELPDCRILHCYYLLLYQPDGGCPVCLLVRA